MAENDPVKPLPQQTAEEVPPEAIATPPSCHPYYPRERETPEVAAMREAEGLPEPLPLKLNQPGERQGGERHRHDAERQRAEAERHRAEQAKAASRK